jgi:hypothetical protein
LIASKRTEAPAVRRRFIPHQESAMLDILMLVLGLGFFAASIGYAYACERL